MAQPGGLADGDGGILFALAALLLMTFGALWQKRSRQAPADVLPLQYAVSLGLCLLIAPVSGFRFTVNAGLIIPVLFLGLLISVVAQLLLYRLLSVGNIVNVTSLFYLVPAITALLDYLLLGNRLPAAAMIGMMAIVGDRAGIPHREGPRRLMASRALRRPVHFPVIFFTHAPGSLF
ncbi:drug/metabolite transporter permease [Klebsiella aerogenes]|nr:drug/metabolite transporter permease [Klebsiella aerogenes]